MADTTGMYKPGIPFEPTPSISSMNAIIPSKEKPLPKNAECLLNTLLPQASSSSSGLHPPAFPIVTSGYPLYTPE